ncbi:MAG: sensor histidine kinase [Eubacteriales bacterium]
MMREKYIKLQYKIMLFFTIGVIIPMFLITIATGYIYKLNLENSTNENSRLLSAQIESNIDTYLDNISQISITPYYDSWIQDQISSITIGGNEFYQNDTETNKMMSDFLFNMMIQNKAICSIFVTDLEGNIIYAKSNGGAMQSQVDFFSPYIQNMEKEYTVIPSHQQSYLKRSNQEVFSYVRVLKEVTTNTPIGYIVLDMKSSAISNLINNMDNSSEDYIAIYLEDNSILKTNIMDDELEEKISELYFQQNNDSATNSIIVDNNEYLMSYAGVSDYGLTAVIFRDKENVFSVINKVVSMTQLLIGVILFFVLINTVLLSRKLTHPFSRLTSAMSKVEKGDFSVRVEKGSPDEIGQLIDCFNTMLLRIDDLIVREYKMELEEKQTEIKALQNQINPHFLYNTLESITMMAEINEDLEVSQMVADLGSFFRFVISKKGAQVTLMEELEYVKTYIRIQNVRYSERIHLTIDCPKELENIKIMKLCIQPLIENCILHGYLHGEEMLIEVSVKKEENLMITVRDYGVGVDEEKLQELIDHIDEAEEKENSIGLKNVHKRLVLMYGEYSGLQFSSVKGNGMKIWFSIPALLEDRGIETHIN